MRLRVDPVACDGVGLCAHLAPGVIRLDRWGYPIIVPEHRDHVGPDHVPAARAAMAGCPHGALHLSAD
jgi:ferredoxin